MNFTVLMSVYSKENPDYLAESFRSLADQTLLPNEVVLVIDGPIGNELESVIKFYKSIIPLKILRLKCNRGLAEALNQGLKLCANELVARMDTDDVSLPERFEKQVEFMKNNPEIDVSSVWVENRDEDLRDTINIRKIPLSHGEILKFSRRRSPISHGASIYKKSKVEKVGGYPLVYPEDYALWSLMLMDGQRFANIQDILYLVRSGDDFLARRGVKFFLGEVKILAFQKKIGFLGYRDFFINITLRMGARFSPLFLRKFLYKIFS